jgi:hypothetical protein
MNKDSLDYLSLLEPLRTRSGNKPINTIPLEKIRLSSNMITDLYKRIYNLQGFSCSSLRDADHDAGKYYYIHIDSYDNSPETINVISEVSPLLTNPRYFEAGCFYNYVITSIVGIDKKTNNKVNISKPELCATKVINMYEFGTKHQQIMFRMLFRDKELYNELSKTYKKIEYSLYVSGEIMCKNDKTIIYNFYSGTYKMKRHISLRRAKYEKAYMTFLINSLAPNYTNIDFQNNSLISNNVLPLNRKELARLKRHNIPMYLFNSQDECTQMRNAVIRYKKEHKVDIINNEQLENVYNTITLY